MLSEDCQIFIGYSSNRENGIVEPLGDNVIIRLVDDSGITIGICGTSSAGAMIGSLVKNPSSLPIGFFRVDSVEIEKCVAAAILNASKKEERERLLNAFQWGLITKQLCKNEDRRLRKHIRYEIENYPTRQWDFAQKRLYRPKHKNPAI